MNTFINRPGMVRVMLQLTEQGQLPDYVDAEYFPGGMTTASAPSDRLDELKRHPGVLGLWLQSEERVAREPLSPATSVALQVPPELAAQVAPLLPGLVVRGARRVEVFSYSRPGEGAYWLAFIISSVGRHAVGTPDQRQLSLGDQVPALLRQLESWAPAANL